MIAEQEGVVGLKPEQLAVRLSVRPPSCVGRFDRRKEREMPSTIAGIPEQVSVGSLDNIACGSSV